MKTCKQPIALQSLGGDSVAVLIDLAEAGNVVQVINGNSSSKLTCIEEIPLYHKISLHPIKRDDRIIRNGVVIGVATAPIEAGALVHIHNIRSLRANLAP